MVNEETVQKLYTMRLGAMATAWQEQNQDPNTLELSFDERFGMLVDAEHLARDNRRLKRLMKQAQLRIPDASLEDVDTSSSRGLDKAQVRQLATGSWIGDKLNILITGKTGVGKSHLACALGQTACRQGHRTLYRRLPRLLEELSLAKADGTYHKLLSKLAKTQVLIIDDLGLSSGLKEAQRQDLLEVLDDRYGQRSTVITSQMPVEHWYDWIGDPTLAEGILDRLVHNAQKIGLQGPSRRKQDRSRTKTNNNS